MDKKKVYITRRIPDEAIELLEEHFHCRNKSTR